MYEKFIELLHFLISVNVPLRSHSCARPIAQRFFDNLIVAETPAERKRIHDLFRRISRWQRVLAGSRMSFRNSMSFFKYANGRLRQQEGVGPIEHGDCLLTDDSDKAEAFSTFFASVYSESSPSPSLSKVTSLVSENLVLTFETVLSKLKQLPVKLSKTPEGIPPVFYKRLAAEMAMLLYLIFTRSLADSQVLDLFLCSIVTPIFKRGNRKLLNNYRPIAQAVIPCIVLERLVVDHMQSFLVTAGLSDRHQHGFTKGRSTKTQQYKIGLRTVQDWALIRNRGNSCHAVYFDLSKAFGKVSHPRLLEKLVSCGFSAQLVNRCAAHLRDRVFRTRVGGGMSELRSCVSGVPRDSSLGPFLWTVYVLDQGSHFPASVHRQLYADDVKAYVEVTDGSEAAAPRLAISEVAWWADKNHMQLSRDKCLVLKSRPCDTVYDVDGTTLPVADCTLDLGGIDVLHA